jgi:arylsulfatase A-like enzyme
MRSARRAPAGFVPAVLLLSVFLSGASPASASEALPQPARPTTVILVTLDSVRVDHVGCYTGGAHPTPGLDALASSGTRFAHAYTVSPSTGPSVATLLTGLLPAHHGWRRDAGGRVTEGVVTLADQFRKAGYVTVALPGSRTLNSEFGLYPGFDRYDDDMPGIRKMRFYKSPERQAPEQLDLALKAIDAAAGKPVFVWLDLYDASYDYEPPEPQKTQFADDPYSGEVAAADAALAGLVDGLKRRGRERTIVVAAGTHGEGLGDHAEYGHGVYLFETTIRAPLLMSGPGIPPGMVVDQPVSLVDVAATILDLAGVPAPAMDGRSLRPLFASGKDARHSHSAKPEPLFVESVHPLQAYGWAPLYAVIDGNRKVVQGRRLEAFDLAADPQETQPLAKPPGWAAKLVAFGASRLEPLGLSVERRHEIDAAAAKVRSRWEDSPICSEKTDLPDPRDPDKRALAWSLYMALLWTERTLLGSATQDAQLVLDSDPSNLAALDTYLRLGVRNHWGDMLLEPLEIMVCQYPYSTAGYHMLGHFYFTKQNWEGAVDAFRLMILAEPDSQEAHYDLACALVQQDRLDEALTHLKRSIDLGGDDYDIIRKDPKLYKLKDDPRFQALLPAS